MGKKAGQSFSIRGVLALYPYPEMDRSVNTIDAGSKAGTGSVFTLVHAVFRLADKQLH